MAGTWKVKIVDKSQVDSGGNIEVLYQVKKGTNVVYDNMRITTTPTTYRDDVTRKAVDLVNSVKQADLITVPETIDLD
jgi:hypothetical protein